jgi:hypothetical protein
MFILIGAYMKNYSDPDDVTVGFISLLVAFMVVSLSLLFGIITLNLIIKGVSIVEYLFGPLTTYGYLIYFIASWAIFRVTFWGIEAIMKWYKHGEVASLSTNLGKAVLATLGAAITIFANLIPTIIEHINLPPAISNLIFAVAIVFASLMLLLPVFVIIYVFLPRRQ